MSKRIPKEFWVVALLFVGVLAALVVAVVFGDLSPRAFAVLAVLSIAFPFLRYWSLFQAAAKEAQPPEARTTQALLSQLRNSIRSAKVRIGILIAVACIAVWETRGGPLAPRLIGLGMLLLLLTGNILSLQQARRTLEQLNGE